MALTNTLNDVKYTDNKNVQVVDEFLQTSFAVDGAEYDYVISFFLKAMKDPTAASNFTDSIYQVSRAADIPVQEIVKSMEGQSGLEMNASLAYYLNGIRSNATLLGVTNVVKPNFYAGRGVLI